MACTLRKAGRTLDGLPAGFSLIELAVTLAIVASIAALGAPLFASASDAARARDAAEYLGGACRQARAEAAARAAASALVFDYLGGRWTIRRCVDGTGNGLRRAEIASGKDPCEAPQALRDLFRGVDIGLMPGLPDPESGAAGTDAVKFGSSDIATFTPVGTATAGTVYVQSDGGAQYAVRVAGTTGRVRVLRFDPRTRKWEEA